MTFTYMPSRQDALSCWSDRSWEWGEGGKRERVKEKEGERREGERRERVRREGGRRERGKERREGGKEKGGREGEGREGVKEGEMVKEGGKQRKINLTM